MGHNDFDKFLGDVILSRAKQHFEEWTQDKEKEKSWSLNSLKMIM